MYLFTFVHFLPAVCWDAELISKQEIEGMRRERRTPSRVPNEHKCRGQRIDRNYLGYLVASEAAPVVSPSLCGFLSHCHFMSRYQANKKQIKKKKTHLYHIAVRSSTAVLRQFSIHPNSHWMRSCCDTVPDYWSHETSETQDCVI